MDPVHVHLITTILLVQFSAVWLDKASSLPYFPIEISRTAASSPLARVILKAGFTSLIGTCLLTQSLTWPRFVLWLGLMLVAWFPDTEHMSLHMSGVAILFVASCMTLWTGWSRQRGMLVVFAVFVYGMRIVFKWVVLWLTDPRLVQFQASHGLVKGFALRNQEIMFGRESVPPDTEAFFKLSGVLQWICFVALSYLF
jgi:hypothetical protein